MLSAGYMEDWQYHATFSGVPQGGIISPLLSNLVLNELDKFVENELIPQHTKGKRRRVNYPYRKLQVKRQRAKEEGDKQRYRELGKQLRSTVSVDPTDPNFRRLRYCRYADDFILGFVGTKSEAREIKARISHFLSDKL
ncbi:MAG: hypothetical protein AAF985_27665, partial [Bacteroidota bacterium]